MVINNSLAVFNRTPIKDLMDGSNGRESNQDNNLIALQKERNGVTASPHTKSSMVPNSLGKNIDITA